MGYSMRTKQYRYTEWVAFDNKHCKPVWTQVYAKEMYDYAIDADEDFNLVYIPQLQGVVKNLSKKLRLGWKYVE